MDSARSCDERRGLHLSSQEAAHFLASQVSELFDQLQLAKTDSRVSSDLNHCRCDRPAHHVSVVHTTLGHGDLERLSSCWLVEECLFSQQSGGRRIYAEPATATSCDPATVVASAKTTFGYDHMNRLTTTTFGDGKASITRTYTKDDLLETVSSDGSVWTNLYNTRRLQTSETLTYGGVNYVIQRGYDANANPKTITYPDTSTVDYAPNALGEPSKAGTFATNVTYFPNGAIKGFTYGNGIVHTMQQNARGLPQRSTDNSGVLNDVYTYDANANVASITDEQMGVTTRTMGYDALDRLETVSSPGLWGMATYGYDSLDNMTSTTITAGGTARTSTHVYNPTTNLLSNISSNVPGYTQSYGYDTRGNITSRGSQGFKFDLANRMYEATFKGTYKYDGFGRRISIVGTDGVNRINVYSQEGKLMYAGIAGATSGINYVYLHNHLVAESSPGYMQYDHTDGLGSPVAITNAAKAVLSRTRYEPYGATAAGTSPTIGFTGHVNAADIGLIYMQQRYYDPAAGRFMSADPIRTHMGGNFNVFAYARSNPFFYTDPDGRAEAPPPIATITVHGQKLKLPAPFFPITETIRMFDLYREYKAPVVSFASCMTDGAHDRYNQTDGFIDNALDAALYPPVNSPEGIASALGGGATAKHFGGATAWQELASWRKHAGGKMSLFGRMPAYSLTRVGGTIALNAAATTGAWHGGLYMGSYVSQAINSGSCL